MEKRRELTITKYSAYGVELEKPKMSPVYWRLLSNRARCYTVKVLGWKIRL